MDIKDVKLGCNYEFKMDRFMEYSGIWKAISLDDPWGDNKVTFTAITGCSEGVDKIYLGNYHSEHLTEVI